MSVILMIDNFDSFTYNLVDYLKRTDKRVEVRRNDALDWAEIDALAPSGVVISPGPGRPSDAGLAPEALARYEGQIPILGVCLGCQMIVEHFGGAIVRAKRPMHGKISKIRSVNDGIFAGLPQRFNVMRYHSLVAEPETLPRSITVIAQTDEGEIMAVSHKTLPIQGVQFHPESILTEYGEQMIRNWAQSL